MATHSSILAWRIPWTEEPGGLQSSGLKNVFIDPCYFFLFFFFYLSLNELEFSGYDICRKFLTQRVKMSNIFFSPAKFSQPKDSPLFTGKKVHFFMQM